MNSVINETAVKALQHRARCGMLIAAMSNRSASFVGWRAYAKALADLQSLAGERLAAKDAQSGGYEPASCLKAAWARLPVNIELLSLVDVQKFLTTQAIQITADAVPTLQADAAQQFDGHAIAVINPDNKHAPAVVDLNDGSGGHGQSLCTLGVDVQVTGIVTSKGSSV